MEVCLFEIDALCPSQQISLGLTSPKQMIK